MPHSRRMPAAQTPKTFCHSPTNFVLRNKKITEYIVDGERSYQERRNHIHLRYHGSPYGKNGDGSRDGSSPENHQQEAAQGQGRSKNV
mmetsp:Transcript_4137/g.5097  ORF Transcript_4137/g.5097 Transcript_4137/m.5097 type:complete len:88 (+) Transcript_4137:202-465(+)